MIDSLICRNLSRAIGMCPPSRWEKVSKGSWVQTMSPFDHKVIDVRSISSAKVTLELSAVEGIDLSLFLCFSNCFYFLICQLCFRLCRVFNVSHSVLNTWCGFVGFGFDAEPIVSILLQQCHGCWYYACCAACPLSGSLILLC